MDDTKTIVHYFGGGFKLVVERHLFSIRQLIGDYWITINCSDDIGRTASLLVAFGYEADMQSALNMLNILNGP
jgi:hypothetical protein